MQERHGVKKICSDSKNGYPILAVNVVLVSLVQRVSDEV
jgi:hypothetical protein